MKKGVIAMKAADKRLMDFGEQMKRHFETQGFHCSVTRPWNNEFEISLKRPGNFDTVQEEIKAVLFWYGFEPIDRPVVGDDDRCVYANIKENIGCAIDENRHYISLFSEFKGSQ